MSVFLDRSLWQEEADGLWLSNDGHHHVCTHCHADHQGNYTPSLQHTTFLCVVEQTFICVCSCRTWTQSSHMWTLAWSSVSSAFMDLDLVSFLLLIFFCSQKEKNASIYTTHSNLITLSFLLPFSSAGVSMALPADLFLQAWRPSAYVISGTISWLSMFLVGILFGYIVVSCCT